MFEMMWLCVFLFRAVVLAAPSSETVEVEFDKRSGLPQITFPDATYQATGYNVLADVGYTYSSSRI